MMEWLWIFTLPGIGLGFYLTAALGISTWHHWRYASLVQPPPGRRFSSLRGLAEALHPGSPEEQAIQARNWIQESMVYSRRNPWDGFQRAFRRGGGYCLQQAEALKWVLDKKGIPCRLVQSMKCRFPPRSIHEYTTQGGLSGHVWVQVLLPEKTLNLDPTAPPETPEGDFEIQAKITPYTGPLKFLGHWGSTMLNALWDHPPK